MFPGIFTGQSQATGEGPQVEGESHDRTNVSLPMIQDTLYDAVMAANAAKPTAMFLVNGGMLAVAKQKAGPAAILETFYGGFWMGTAIAEVLFGDYNPGGKMPFTTYPADYVKSVKMSDMSMLPSATSPGRSYRYYKGPVLWPFGFGLSYTTFTVTRKRGFGTKQQLSSTGERGNTPAPYTVTVKNTGSVAGDEVHKDPCCPFTHEFLQ